MENKVRKLTKENIKEIHRDIEMLRNTVLMFEDDLNYGELHPEVYQEYLQEKEDFEYWSKVAANHLRDWGY